MGPQCHNYNIFFSFFFFLFFFLLGGGGGGGVREGGWAVKNYISYVAYVSMLGGYFLLGCACSFLGTISSCILTVELQWLEH